MSIELLQCTMMALESVLSVLSFDDKSLVVIACVRAGVVVTMIQCYPTMTPNIFILADHCRLDSPAAQLRH